MLFCWPLYMIVLSATLKPLDWIFLSIGMARAPIAHSGPESRLGPWKRQVSSRPSARIHRICFTSASAKKADTLPRGPIGEGADVWLGGLLQRGASGSLGRQRGPTGPTHLVASSSRLLVSYQLPSASCSSPRKRRKETHCEDHTPLQDRRQLREAEASEAASGTSGNRHGDFGTR